MHIPPFFVRRLLPAIGISLLLSAGFSFNVSAATATTTTLTSSANPANYGQTITLTATVSPTTATGTVDFFDGTTKLDAASATVSSTGTATFTISALSLGSHSLTATYNGDTNNSPSTSAALSQTVNTDPTTVTLTDSLSGTGVYGQTVAFTAKVSNGMSNTPVPSGTVTFNDGNTFLDSETIAAGVATFTDDWYYLTTGTHAITAVYSGDTTNAGSTSAADNYVVNKAGTLTDWISSSDNPSVTGEVVTFDADIDVIAPGHGTATGTATFYDGATTLGTVGLDSSGHAYLSTSAFSFGANNITVSYSGDANHNSSTSPIFTQTVLWSTSIVLTSSPNPSLPGQSITITATVTSSGGSTPPTGTVEFENGGTSEDGGTWLGNATLNSSGVATLTVALPNAGSYTLTAEYETDSNNGESFTTTAQTVNRAPTSTLLSCNASGAVINTATTCTALVTDTAPLPTPPSGTVQWYGTGVSITPLACSIAVNTSNTSSCSVSVSPIIIGSASLYAVYGGDANHSGSTSATQTLNGTAYRPGFTRILSPSAGTALAPAPAKPAASATPAPSTATASSAPAHPELPSIFTEIFVRPRHF